MDTYSENIFDRIDLSLAGIDGFLEIMWEANVRSNTPEVLRLTLAHVQKTVDEIRHFLSDNFGEVKVEMEGDKMLRVIFDPVKRQNRENGSAIKEGGNHD